MKLLNRFWHFNKEKTGKEANRKEESDEDSQEEQFFFQSLRAIPKESLTVYEKALDFAFSEESVYNVALSGSYGSGKSTIIESYKEKSDKNFLHISLGHFNEDVSSKDINEQSLIEGKILNQLIHQIPEKNLPKITFKTPKEKVSWWKIARRSGFISISFLSFVYLFNFSNWKQYTGNLHPSLSIIPIILTVSSFTVLGLFVFYCSYRLIETQKNKNIFRKVKLSGNEIDIFQEDSSPYFDKYLGDILYILNSADKDIIVFEDLDRYETTSPIVFERLREINFLLNSYFYHSCIKKKVFFLYLIRDDIFTEKERTKFFDFIIPVIPVVDTGNSFEKIFKLSGKLQLKNNLSREEIKSFHSFLRDVSLYIDDYRLIKNIFNEFQIYKSRILKEFDSLSLEKMLALITYKNIFPKDFAGLAFRKGFVYSLLEDETKKQIALSELEKIKQRKKKFIDKESQEKKIQIHEEFFEFLKTKKRERYNNNPHYDLYEYEVSKFGEKLLDLENQKIRSEEQILKLDSDEKEIKSRLDDGLQYIVTDTNIDKIFTTNTFLGGEKDQYNSLRKNHYFDLIKYLLSNGYIDENYHEYISLFYDDSLSRQDKKFLLSIKNKKAEKPTYLLKNIELIVESLRPKEFQQKEAINYNLINYLMSHEWDNQESRENFDSVLYQLSQNLSYFIEYFKDFCLQEKKSLVVITLNVEYPDFFVSLKEDCEANQNMSIFWEYIILTLFNSDYSILATMNQGTRLNDIILEQEEFLFLGLVDRYKKSVCANLSTLSIRFNKLGTHLDEIWDHVYRNSLYKITFENISYILQKEYGIENEEDIQAKNYSLIREKKTSPLYKYIEANIEQYFSIILKASQKIEDEEEAIQEILNHEKLSQETKEKYIKQSSGKIENIPSIEDKDLWSLLMENLTVSYTMENILEYFSYLGESELDDSLISFINKGEGEFIIPDSLKVKNKKLFNFIVQSEKVKDKKYKDYFKASNLRYSSFEFSDIPSSKFKILVDLSVVRINEDDVNQAKKNLSFIRDNYSENLFYFIKKNLEEYFELEDFPLEEILELLDWEIEDEKKIKLLSHTQEPISIQDLNLSSNVQEHILNNHLNEDDIPYLVNNFDYLSVNKDYLLSLFLDYEYTIEENLDSLPEGLIQKVMENSKFSKNLRGSLLTKRKSIEKEEIKDFLTNWDSTLFNAIYTYKKNQLIPKNSLNEQLLDFLKEKEIIRDFYIPEGKNDFKVKGIKNLRIKNE